MDYQAAANLINELVEIAQPGVPIGQQIDQSYHSFGIGKNSIAYIGNENLSVFNQKVDKLYRLQKEIAETYSYKSFETDVANAISFSKSTGEKISSYDAENLFSRVLSIECAQSEIIREEYYHESKFLFLM
jgi:hypothetical protein